jgi:hypothetical protein
MTRGVVEVVVGHGSFRMLMIVVGRTCLTLIWLQHRQEMAHFGQKSEPCRTRYPGLWPDFIAGVGVMAVVRRFGACSC